MDWPGIGQLALLVGLLTALTPLLGGYMARVFSGERVWLTPLLAPVERGALRLFGAEAERDQNWKRYGLSLLAFSAASWVVLYLILATQSIHPWNPQGLGAMPWDVNFNTTTSFVTNTNWQFYAGETTLSNFSQMAGLAVQNFVSAAVGIAVAIALIRGIVSRSGDSLGNFWRDLTRAILYILLPLSILATIFFISQGVIQNLSDYVRLTTLTGHEQVLGMGPNASQEAIKLIGTNGGGFFNVNSAMPFSNPSGLTNFVQVFLILLIPTALTATFGRMVGSRRQGWAIFAAMMALFLVAVVVVHLAESNGSPAQHLAGIAGGNMEGKETRFGISGSSLFAAVTTVASCGAVNAAMESLTGLGGAVPMANMMTGEVIFGGVGAGLYGMLMMVLLAVFLAGLMVGRTPEYLGKRIGAREVKLVAIAALATPLTMLAGSGLAMATKWGDPSIYNGGPQGFSETLYAYVSQAANNGSAFAGYTGFLQPNGDNVGAFGITFADLMGSAALFAGRFIPIIAILAVAGALAGKRVAPEGAGTFRTDNPTFVVLLIGVVLLVALLTFVPALLLGPIVQSLSEGLFA
ncbi:MAG: potassium-transporting ATPase subunit KdpA [Solirubrobacterales bacterium]|nr:potassium-transporting ATPase subunit KdpA [Solirubrobacterales bacterium]